MGRNEPCPCGSGKKHKRCCIDNDLVGSTIKLSSARINLDSFPPRIEGFDDMPDLKFWLGGALIKKTFDDNFDPQTFMNEEMNKYNNRISEVNSKLPKLYGEMLRDMKQLIADQKYEEAIKIGDSILNVFPESIEAIEMKDSALFFLNRHPLQMLLFNSPTLDKSSRKELLENFSNDIRLKSNKSKEQIFSKIYEYYSKSESWEQKYLALDIINPMVFILSVYLNESSINKLDELLLKALTDDDGRVRNNAFYCVSYRRGLNVPFELFFNIYNAAKSEKSLPKKYTLCRAILDIVAPITDDAMKAVNEWDAYRKAIDFALEVTGYDPAYYKASLKEKVIMQFNDPKRSYLTRKRTVSN